MQSIVIAYHDAMVVNIFRGIILQKKISIFIITRSNIKATFIYAGIF